jgi:hypothetical protein
MKIKRLEKLKERGREHSHESLVVEVEGEEKGAEECACQRGLL